jgi:hypothetical protein
LDHALSVEKLVEAGGKGKFEATPAKFGSGRAVAEFGDAAEAS